MSPGLVHQVPLTSPTKGHLPGQLVLVEWSGEAVEPRTLNREGTHAFLKNMPAIIWEGPDNCCPDELMDAG